MTAVVLIDGPEWWGDSSMSPENRPVRLERAADRVERRTTATAERKAVEAIVGGLPDGCLVIHTSGRGASATASAAAARRGLPTAAWPAWPGRPNTDRNDAVVAALIGLRAEGHPVKAVLFGPGVGHAADQNELVTRLRQHRIFVRIEGRFVEPEPPVEDPGTA